MADAGAPTASWIGSTGEDHGAARRPGDAGDDVEQRRLPCPVGAGDPEGLAAAWTSKLMPSTAARPP